MNNENQENYTTPYNEWLSTYYSGSKQDFKEPLHFPDYPLEQIIKTSYLLRKV